ncbi:hypothetical protein JCM6882_008473 [Rhodosporidiobolus microsporus]
MTQLPFPSSLAGTPYGAQAAPHPPALPYDPSRRASLSGSVIGAPLQGGGAPLPTGHQVWSPAPQGAYGAAYPQQSPSTGASMGQAFPQAGYAPFPPSQSFPASATSPIQPSSPFPAAPTHPYHSQAQPQRSSTLPATPVSPSHPLPQPAVNPAAAALQAHHRSLVAHYWSYAQQGFSAPLTAEPGSEERERQVKARQEAVDWARQVGIAVQDPPDEPAPLAAAAPRERAASRPLPAAPIPPTARERTTSRPLPVAPSGSAAPPPVPSVPASYRPASPTKASQQGLGRSVSLAGPPSPSSASPSGGLARSVSDAVPRSAPLASAGAPAQAPTSPVAAGKRPLPVPPPARASTTPSHPSFVSQLESGISNITISAPQAPPPRSSSPAPPAVPSISLPGDDSSSSTVPPAVPTFSFGKADAEDDDDTYIPAPPAVPTFSFGGADDDDDFSRPAPSPPKPVLHPRHDPSHPSHHLYHPTSVSSPLPPPPSSTSSGSLSALSSALAGAPPEAGTITCTSCRAPIFGRVLVALDRQWHPACFVCAEDGCGLKLEVMEFEGTPEDWVDEEYGDVEEEDGSSDEDEAPTDSSEDEEGWVKAPRVVVEGDEEKRAKKKRRIRRGESLQGKAWCMVHFEERFALHCHHCSTPIASADYLPITDPLLPPTSPSSPSSTRSSASHHRTRYYHPLHFFCAGCGDTFIDAVAYERSLHPSGSASGAPTAGLEVKPYFAREGHPYCERCDLRMWRPKCPGCRKGLREEDGFLEVPVGAGGEGGEEGEQRETQKWHEGCFKCSLCTRPLTSIYLLRLETALIPRTRKQGGGFDEVEEERPYCAECYDVRAKEEAERAVAEGKRSA